ncbi:MAG: HAD family phosphatase [Rhizobiaceae bacterium]|nr:HAD family phosphatase [Rhizobiaceae bacterium]
MTGFDLIIFDCDGVLVDSEIIAAQLEAKLLTDAGFPIDAAEMVERYAGMDWKSILLAVEKEASIPLQASLLERSEQLLDEKLAKSVKAIPGVPQAISRLPYKRCICSNSSSRRLDSMLKRTGYINLFAPHIFSAVEVAEKRTKPAPDVFLHAAEQMQANIEKTIVIEDSVHGIAGAKAAGMRVIGFTGASHSYPSHADHLTQAGAETVINRMMDLPAVVEALSGWSAEL